MINESEVRRWWDIFKRENPLTEVRILGRGKTFSGYYTNPEQLIADIRNYDGYGIYATINAIKDSCYGRTQHDCILQKPKATTSDNDIEFRTTLLIDLDPERSSDTNASDAEKALAWETAKNIIKYLADQGFEKPVIADSANGYHLLYKIYLDNIPENTELIKNFLQVLDMLFSSEAVKIDTSVFNASRISKLIGTKSAKGTDTPERPQRQSFFYYVPESYKEVDIAYIKKVASYLPKPEQPSKYNNYSTEKFDIRSFISEHNIKIAKETRFSGGLKLVLDECPFGGHKAPDSALFVMDSGAIAFRCLHNSCQHFHWREFRLHYDPQAYDRREREEYARKRRYYGGAPQKPVEPIVEDKRGKVWLSMKDIVWQDPSELVSIASGITALDRKIMGFTLGDLTIFSGLSGAGKTTFLDFFALNAVQRGEKTAIFSGELQGPRFQSWIDQMAAGKAFVRQKAGYENIYYAPKNVSDKINDWLDGKLFLYNNDYGSNWDQLYDKIVEIIHTEGVKLVMIDNLMALDFDDSDQNSRETRFIKQFKDLCKRENIHGILVCHPRKEQSFQLLRKESIAGTANLTNLCDNLIISHRVGNDFEKRARDFFGAAKVAEYMGFDVVLEIVKNRSIGVTDYLIGLYYEPETRRIKNDIAENIIFGWQEEPVQTSFEQAPSSLEDIDDLPL